MRVSSSFCGFPEMNTSKVRRPQSDEENNLVSDQPFSPGEEKKTVAIRVSPSLRGRLDSVLQITGLSVNDAGIEAIEDWITKKLSDSKLREKALASLDEEERELKDRRKALQSLMGEGTAAPDQPSTRGRGKSS